MNVSAIPTRLRATERPALEAHFIALDAEDRRLRFGTAMSDEVLRAYVARIDFERDRVFAIHDDGLGIVAAVHIAPSGCGAELGLSVLPGFRRQGLGSALFARAVVHLRNRGIGEVFVHCAAENAAMLHLARKHRMRIVHQGPDRAARLALAI